MKLFFINLFAIAIIVFGLMALATPPAPSTYPNLSYSAQDCCTAANGASCCTSGVCAADGDSCVTKKCSIFRRIFGGCKADVS